MGPLLIPNIAQNVHNKIIKSSYLEKEIKISSSLSGTGLTMLFSMLNKIVLLKKCCLSKNPPLLPVSFSL